MIKWVVAAAAVSVGIAFAAGTYVGWRTTLKVVENVSDSLGNRKDDAN